MKAETIYDLINKKTEEYLEDIQYKLDGIIRNNIDKQINETIRHITVNKQYDISTAVKDKTQEIINNLDIKLDDSDIRYIVSSIKSNLKNDIIETQRYRLKHKLELIMEAYDNNILTVGKARATLENLLSGPKEATK